MNEKELFEAIGEADEDILEKSESKPKNAFGWVKWTSLAAACAVIGLAAADFIPDDDIPVEPIATTASAVSSEEDATDVTHRTTAATTTAVPAQTTTTTPLSASSGADSASEAPISTTENTTTAPTTTENVTSSEEIIFPAINDTTTSICSVPAAPVESSTITSTVSIDTRDIVKPAEPDIVVPVTRTESDYVMPDMEAYNSALLFEAVYPEMPEYPDENDEKYLLPSGAVSEKYYDDWSASGEAQRAQTNQPDGYNDGLDDFCVATMKSFLKGENGENVIYSPLNLYLSLGMLSEITDGTSSRQILKLLGTSDPKALREKIYSLWNANYCNNGLFNCTLANSLWLNSSTEYRTDTLETLSEAYYASSFAGDSADTAYSTALQEWLSVQTNGVLEEQAASVSIPPNNIITLASTVYFNAQWENRNKFNADFTAPEVFTTLSGEEIICDFMKQSDELTFFYTASDFTASYLDFNTGGYYNAKMWFLLPNEDKTTEDVLNSDAMLELITSETYYVDTGSKKIDGLTSELVFLDISIPKFDVSYESDFLSKLAELGITDVLNPETADYSPLSETESDGIYLSEAIQAVRVAIDEKGCTAASFMVMPNPATGGFTEPIRECEFFLTRPFVFCITGTDNTPLFIGIVNNPVA